MNAKMIGTVAAFGLVSAQVFAETSYETAQVTESRAIYEVVEISTPQEQCWEEEAVVERRGSDNRSNTPVLVSTILGGDIMRHNESPSSREYQTVQRCETVYQKHEEERLVGYQVTYIYNSEEYSVRTNTDPGDEIRVRVSVQPVL